MPPATLRLYRHVTSRQADCRHVLLAIAAITVYGACRCFKVIAVGGEDRHVYALPAAAFACQPLRHASPDTPRAAVAAMLPQRCHDMLLDAYAAMPR